ncbi:MAG: gluconate 2-dehydrogenase subunit gamma [Rhodospirillales bacterium]|nr:gluconate 2-dehydrogenase subunit gamma [Rhodospirillales bacterium]
MRRRDLLTTTASLVVAQGAARAGVIKGALPWEPGAGVPPDRVVPGPWQFFTADEAAAVEAMVDRVIPPDPETPGGKDAGCAVFIDRQLAGAYGKDAGLYRSAPFQQGTRQQGDQSPATLAERYRQNLAALDRYCRASRAGKTFAQLDDSAKDEILGGLEKDAVQLDQGDGAWFFAQLLKDTKEGFFADPIYGGNREMVAWKMIGFPGARYDYRDWIDHHNERYPLPPVAMTGRPEWKTRGR